MGKPKTIVEYQREIQRLQTEEQDAKQELTQITQTAIPAKSQEVLKAKTDVELKTQEIKAATVKLRTELKELETTLKAKKKEETALEERKELLDGRIYRIPRSIKEKQRRIDELKPKVVAPPRTRAVQPQTSPSPSKEQDLNDLGDLAEAMKKIEHGGARLVKA